MTIASVVQSQLLSVFLDAIGTSPAIRTGAIVEARVVEGLPDGRYLVAIGKQFHSAELRFAGLADRNPPLPGERLTLRVVEAGPTPTFAVTARGAGAALDTPTSQIARPAQTPVRPQPDAQPATPAIDRAAARAVLAQSTFQAAARQNGLAPLFADLAGTLSRGGTNVPLGIVGPARALLGLRLDGERPVTAGALREAVRRSGIFVEARAARAAAGASPEPSPAILKTGQPGPADIKTALVGLQRAARDVPGVALVDSAGLATPPEPPRRNGLPAPQASTEPSIHAALSRAEVADLVATRADAAIERIKLYQLASTPAPDQPGQQPAAERADQKTQWMFEVPLAFGQRTAIAEFQIERDGHSQREAEEARRWRMRFSVDTDRTGPVHALVALSGASVAVTLWAERPETGAIFRDLSDRLRDALRASEFEIASLTVRDGRPPAPVNPNAPSHYFLDRQS